MENNLFGETGEEVDVVVGKPTTKTQAKETNYLIVKLFALTATQTQGHSEDHGIKILRAVFLAAFFVCRAW